MYFVGVDLAWGTRMPTGVAVVDHDGDLVHLGTARDDAGVMAMMRPYVDGDCLVGIDAPLVVTNPTGQRPAERALNRDFRRFEAAAHPTNTSKPEFANGPRGARLAAALRLDIDPRCGADRCAIEVYPHPATVVLFRLGRTLKYKAKPGRSFEALRSELLRLIAEIERLDTAAVALRVTDNDHWIDLHRRVRTAERKSQLRRAEDPVDAVVCAYVALYTQRRPADITLYGDVDTGYIVTPTLPSNPPWAPRPTDPATPAGERRRCSARSARSVAR